MTPPEALILAGPNGAGKTTSSTLVMPPGMRFINNDVVAARLLSEGHPPAGVDVAAGRLVLAELRGVVESGESFCIETNLAGRGFVRWIADWRDRGYTVRLVFTALESPELALRRVAGRVASGGHDIPEPVVRRRWAGGLRSLFDVYLPLADGWTLFDNSGRHLQRVAEQTWEEPMFQIVDAGRWRVLCALAASVGSVAARSGTEVLDAVLRTDDDGEPQA